METGSVFEGLNPRTYEAARKMPEEIRGLIDAAFSGGDGDIANFSVRVSTLNINEQDSVFCFLLMLEDRLMGEVCSLHVSQSAVVGREYMDVLRKVVVVSKLLKCIAPYVGIGMRIGVYDENIATYQSILDYHEALIAGRNSVSKDVSDVTGDLA